MEMNPDTLLKECIERNYQRLTKVYKYRMEKARDKEFVVTQFINRFVLYLPLRENVNGDYPESIEILDNGIKLGIPVIQSIKKLRRIHKKINHEVKLEDIGNINPGEGLSLSIEKNITRFSDPNNLSDEEIIRLFAQYKAYRLFSDFLMEEAKPFLEEEKPSSPLKALLEDAGEKNKEYTTSRQVLAVHYLLKYCQVKNIDMTEKARFIQFLTGKNYDNIYKRVQSPLNGNDRHMSEDLKFVRGYFERLGMKEIAKMISNELDQSV
jgi:hypothetical protein